jgi:hypothetical protein
VERQRSSGGTSGIAYGIIGLEEMSEKITKPEATGADAALASKFFVGGGSHVKKK